MAERRLRIIAFLLFLCMLPCTVLAASTTDAQEPISTTSECSLTISYSYQETAFAGQTVMLYQIADVSADFQYMLTGPFMSSDLVLNGVQTQGEWNVIRSTLEAHIMANELSPTATATTDEFGQACFVGLKPGLYLASAVTVVQEELTCFFDSALVALPGLGEDGLWQYQVKVSAKPMILPPLEPDEEIRMKVVKLWRGDEGRTDRPKAITVEIFRDGVSYETVALSDDNNWSYSWTAKDDGASWKVVERNIPDGYTMTVEQRNASFVLTNTRQSPPDLPPSETGDTMNVMLYTVLMYISGTMLIILGIIGKRKRHE